MEKRKSVTQKVIERFERVRAYLVARPALFATQGTVVATSRTYCGRQLGPYFQIAWPVGHGRHEKVYDSDLDRDVDIDPHRIYFGVRMF